MVKPCADEALDAAVLLHDAARQEVRAVAALGDGQDMAVRDAEFDVVEIRLPAALMIGDLHRDVVPDDGEVCGALMRAPRRLRFRAHLPTEGAR